jgi:hypothetical protein
VIHLGHTYLFRDLFVRPTAVKPYGRGLQIHFRRVDGDHPTEAAGHREFVMTAVLQRIVFEKDHIHVLQEPVHVPVRAVA